jgi:polar amino acid transport system substrate-binding protein
MKHANSFTRRTGIVLGFLSSALVALPAAAQETAPVEPVAAPAEAIQPVRTLERIRAAGRISFGYLADARPFSYRDEAGKAAGYTVALCTQVAETVKAELGLPALAVDWIPVSADSRFADLHQGKVDLLCGAETATLARRKAADFSVPMFLDGIGALLRADAPVRLKDVLSEGPGPARPLWRASMSILELRTFSAVAGTTGESWLKGKINTLGIRATVAPAGNFAAGVARVQDGSSDVFFGDRAVLLEAARGAPAGDLVVLNRRFTHEPLALALARGDDDFRLLVDASLSRLYRSEGFPALYTQWFGEPDDNTLTFYRTSGLPE